MRFTIRIPNANNNEALLLSALIRKYSNVLFDAMRPVVLFVNYYNQIILKGAYLNRPL